ncbi:MAG: NAD(P)/FAD-dependent oxidoreductase [Promethearchaeati archaeon]
MTNDFDIIVIGAGFGGPVAAKICADAGLGTMLIERAEKPGEKVISGLTIPFYGFLFGPEFITNGNPPIERPADGIINYIILDIDKGIIEIDDSLNIPKPLSPIIAFGYNTYCQPFCEWETDMAIKSGVTFLNATTVVEIIKEDGIVKGVETDKGEKFYCKILIDAEGSQGLLAVNAGVREKYPPEMISLADTYDYVMPKKLLDNIFGYSVRFCWGWDEQKIAPPLGYGNGLMLWPYRESIHFIQDQCLVLENNKIPNLKKNFQTFHKNITSKLPFWKNNVAPYANLRAKMFQGFEIFVGLKKNLRNMPNYTGGMLLIGDAAGLESTELCDGVPSAWFSAEIAAKVAISAIEANDFSASFLSIYDKQIRDHPIIQWSISGRNRYDLRFVQKTHNKKELKKYIHNGWGLGALTHFTMPLIKMVGMSLREQPYIIKRWIKMYFRYFQNYIYNNYGTKISKYRYNQIRKNRNAKNEILFRSFLHFIDIIIEISVKLYKMLKRVIPSAEFVNPFIKRILPKFEPLFMKIINFLEPFLNLLSHKLIKFTRYANPNLFT